MIFERIKSEGIAQIRPRKKWAGAEQRRHAGGKVSADRTANREVGFITIELCARRASFTWNIGSGGTGGRGLRLSYLRKPRFVTCHPTEQGNARRPAGEAYGAHKESGKPRLAAWGSWGRPKHGNH